MIRDKKLRTHKLKVVFFAHTDAMVKAGDVVGIKSLIGAFRVGVQYCVLCDCISEEIEEIFSTVMSNPIKIDASRQPFPIWPAYYVGIQ